MNNHQIISSNISLKQYNTISQAIGKFEFNRTSIEMTTQIEFYKRDTLIIQEKVLKKVDLKRHIGRWSGVDDKPLRQFLASMKNMIDE